MPQSDLYTNFALNINASFIVPKLKRGKINEHHKFQSAVNFKVPQMCRFIRTFVLDLFLVLSYFCLSFFIFEVLISSYFLLGPTVPFENGTHVR